MTYPLLALLVCLTSIASLIFARVTGRFLVAAVGAAAIILYLHGALYLNYTSDDAYISYRYAQHLADGLGLVWNSGVHVEGYSNFLWVIILAGTHAAGADIVFSGRWLGFAAAGAAAGAAYLLVEELVERKDAARYAGLGAALALASSGPFALWSYAGLETSLFALLVAVAAILHIREQRGAGVPVSGMVWALVFLTRPDGIVLFAVSAFFKVSELILAIDSERDPDRAFVRRASPRALAEWLGGFALIFVPYFAWRYETYGWLLPNSYYAKVGRGTEQYQRGARYLFDFAQQYAGWLVLLAAPALLLRGLRQLGALYVLALLGVWVAYVVVVGGDGLLRFRFFAEVLPLFYALVAASIAVIIISIRIDGARAPVLRAASAIVVGAGLLAFTLQSTPSDPFASVLPAEGRAVSDRVEIGRWLREHAPPDTVIAVLAAGAIPYESRLTTIDMLGLNDEHIAHRSIQVGGRAAGHEKFDAEYVLGRRPDAIILFDGLQSAPATRQQYDQLLFAITPAASELVSNPRLWISYEPRGVGIGGRWFSALVRRDSPLIAATTPPPS
jgi:arabinofuranosyltransferase